jgi:hypothetical protein
MAHTEAQVIAGITALQVPAVEVGVASVIKPSGEEQRCIKREHNAE